MSVTPSDDADLWHKHSLAMWRDGWRAGLAHGRELGRVEAEADQAAAWREFAEPIAHPERDAERRIRAAIAAERRDAAEHERAFAAKARNTHDRDRAPAQHGAVTIYGARTGA